MHATSIYLSSLAIIWSCRGEVKPGGLTGAKTPVSARNTIAVFDAMRVVGRID
jgi:hypothetical protein